MNEIPEVTTADATADAEHGQVLVKLFVSDVGEIRLAMKPRTVNALQVRLSDALQKLDASSPMG